MRSSTKLKLQQKRLLATYVKNREESKLNQRFKRAIKLQKENPLTPEQIQAVQRGYEREACPRCASYTLFRGEDYIKCTTCGSALYT